MSIMLSFLIRLNNSSYSLHDSSACLLSANVRKSFSLPPALPILRPVSSSMIRCTPFRNKKSGKTQNTLCKELSLCTFHPFKQAGIITMKIYYPFISYLSRRYLERLDFFVVFLVILPYLEPGGSLSRKGRFFFVPEKPGNGSLLSFL